MHMMHTTAFSCTPWLQARYPGIAPALGPRLHRVARGAAERLVDCSGGDAADFTFEGGTKRKLDALDSVLREVAAPRAIVFCNKLESCRAVENFLRRQDRSGDRWAPLAMHAAVAPAARAANMRAFLCPPAAGEAARILVCTDRCAPPAPKSN